MVMILWPPVVRVPRLWPVLAAAGVAAMVIETNWFMRGASVHDLGRFVILFTVLGKISMLVMGVHHRLWVRATMRDILALQFWLLVAAVATFSLFSLLYVSLEWSALRLTVMSYVLACVGLCAPRVALELLRDFGLEARHKSRKGNAGEEYLPVVVLGAGDLGSLLLEHLKSSAHDIYPGVRLLGFIDETKVMHGRKLRSFKVLGGLSVVPKLVKEAGLKGIILAINNPRQELVNELAELADRYDLKIYRWKVGLEEG